MISIIRAEFYKLRKLKKFYAAFITVNLAPAFMLLVLAIIYVKGLFYGVGFIAEFKKEITNKAIVGIFYSSLYYFSWLAWVYVMMLVGEIVSKEFSDGTMKMMFTRPITRLSIFTGKFLSVLLFYIGMITSYMISLGVVVLSLKAVIGIRYEQFNLEPMIFIKIFFAFVVIDISYISLVFMVGMLASSVGTTFSYSIYVSMFLMFLDGSLSFLKKINALDNFFTNLILDYSFIGTTWLLSPDKMEKFVMGKEKAFPISFDKLASNFTYTIIFFIIAAILFSRRESS